MSAHAPTTPMIRLAALAALVLLPLTAACGDSQAAAEAVPDDPAGTVLAIELDGARTTITADEVDAWLPTVRRLEPASTLPALRRLVLTNITLPLKVSQMIAPEAREEARSLAQDTLDVINEGLIEYKDVPQMEAAEGTFLEIGLDVWGRALEMEEDDWTPVFETVGAFVFFRFVAIPEGPVFMSTPILIERGIFPYLEAESARSDIEAAYDRAVLTIVDPGWETIVPAHYVYRMQPE